MTWSFEQRVFVSLQQALASLARIESSLATQQKETVTIMLDLTALQTAVAAETTVDQSVETLLTNLAAQIQQNIQDPVALAALVTTMQQNAATLATAVTTNTPAA